jgi:hypothetical protein
MCRNVKSLTVLFAPSLLGVAPSLLLGGLPLRPARS